MSARQSKQRRDEEERKFRADVLALVEAQKGVIGALARGLTTARKDIEELKQVVGFRATYIDPVLAHIRGDQ